MKTLQAAVERTLRYAAFFKFPLTQSEIHYWLSTGRVVSRPRVIQVLNGPGIPRSLRRFAVKSLTPTRRYRAQLSQKKLMLAHRVARVIASIPFVKMVALTGSAAIGNSKSGDDLDLMIITGPDTLWFSRPLVTLITEIFFHRRRPLKPHKGIPNEVCLNLWLDEHSLAVPKAKRNFYTAHEVLQLQPLVNRRGTYEKFLGANSWVKDFLANAWKVKQETYHPVKTTSPKTSAWSGLNRLAFYFQYRYMKNKMTREIVDLHRAYFHPQDWDRAITSYLEKGR